jgi:hypothetical protein
MMMIVVMVVMIVVVMVVNYCVGANVSRFAFRT